VTDDGLQFTTAVERDRAAGIARVSWTPERPAALPAAARRLADVGWRGLVTVGVAPDGDLAEVAAGFSLDLAVLERVHGVDAVELALRSAVGGRLETPLPEAAEPRAAVAVQLRSTLPPGEAGIVTGRLPSVDRPIAAEGAEVVAVHGYDRGDRLDGWYDALLATISSRGPDVATAARGASSLLSGLPDTGVPHDGAEVSAVLDRLASGRAAGIR
jgi:acetyl/propionyl-CoA carboxylase alpha subunit